MRFACAYSAQRACFALSWAGIYPTPEMEKTGWPPPPLMQDDDRKLFRWFASKPDARRLVRESAQRIAADRQALSKAALKPSPQALAL